MSLTGSASTFILCYSHCPTFRGGQPQNSPAVAIRIIFLVFFGVFIRRRGFSRSSSCRFAMDLRGAAAGGDPIWPFGVATLYLGIVREAPSGWCRDHPSSIPCKSGNFHYERRLASSHGRLRDTFTTFCHVRKLAQPYWNRWRYKEKDPSDPAVFISPSPLASPS